VRALREIGLDADMPADEPTTEGVIAAMRRHDFGGHHVGVQLYPRNPNRRLMDFIDAAGGGFQFQYFPMAMSLRRTIHGCSLSSTVWLVASLMRSHLPALRRGDDFAMSPTLRGESQTYFKLQANCRSRRRPDRRVRA